MEQENNIQQMPPSQGVKYAGFWRRFVAYIIDNFIVGFIQQIVILPFFIILGGFGMIFEGDIIVEDFSYSEFPDDFALAVAFMGVLLSMALFSIVSQWLYFSLMESSKYQGTLGKIALNIKVVDYQGGRISFLRATGRYFSKIISAIIFMIGYIMAGFTAKKQALHDIIAETYVIKKP